MPNVQYIDQQKVKLEQYDIADDFERYLESLLTSVYSNKEDTLKI